MQRAVELRRTARDIMKNEYFNQEYKPSVIMQKTCEWIEKAMDAKTRKEAHDCYLNAVEVYKEINEEDIVLAKFYVKLGDTAEKEEDQIDYYMKSLVIHNKFGSMTMTLAKIYYKLGTKQKVGSEAKQIEYLQKAIKTCDHVGIENVTKAKACSHLGNLVKDKDQRKKYYNDALRIFEHLKKIKEELANTYFNVTSLLENDNEITENSKKAIVVFEELKIKSVTKANSYRIAAKQARKAGHIEEANNYARLAYDSYKSLLYPENEKADEVAKEFNLSV